MNKTHKRNIVALLVLVIAVAGMFLIVRKVVLDNARVTIASVMQAEEENLKRSVREWQKDLYLISREGTAARLARKAGRRSINTERTRLEETFRAYMRLRKDYIESIRLVDSRGNERVVVDRQGPSREYLKVFSEKFYRNAMAERPFRAVGTLATTDTGMAILDYAINIADQGEKIGVLSIRIDLDAIIENLKKSSGDVSFNHLYLFNKQEQLVFDKALLPTVEELENNSAIKIFSLIKQEGSAARMFEHDGSFWAFFDIDPLQMSLVLKMNDENLYETVLEKFVPISILFGFAIVALLLFRKGRRKFRRLGSLVVEESGTFKKKKSKVPQVVPDSQLIRSKDLNNISSQIRQPLNNILSTLSLLGASGLNKKQDEYLEQLTKSSEWISELLNQITDYAALRKGRLRLESANFDVRDVLNEVSSILSVESYKKGIQVQAVVNFDVPDTLIGDPTRVRYILLNLVGNAIRSAEQGDISVTVSTKKGKDDTVKLRIEIAESGIGVETEFAYTIFTEFERAEVITETDAAHSSMYFNLSRLLVNLMGGEVGYMDNALGGNTFWLDLPFKVPNTGQVSNARTLLFGQRALIVAKSEKNRKSIATILTNWGISCHTSNDPLAAQEKINRAKEMGNPYTILFVDVSSRAPVDHVVKMLEEVNLSQVMKNGAVFMLASKDLMGDDQVRQALGVDAIVYKPVNRQILKEELLRAVKPLSTGMQQSTLAPSSNLSLESEPGTDVETRVLILESDQAHQKVLSSIIGEFGIEVDVASESADAFAALQLKSYDMVLVDYELPEVSASYIAKKIRKLEVTSGKNGGLDGETSVRTNIVFLIDRELEGKRDKLLEQGADDTLIKPVTSALMSQFLSKWDLIMPDSENDAFMMTGSN